LQPEEVFTTNIDMMGIKLQKLVSHQPEYEPRRRQSKKRRRRR
jgi:hypothetical protein